jgi:orotidine-5'-phosphate decarboxylase
MNVEPSKNSRLTPLYRLFLKWAIINKVDGIIVGGTFPKIIKNCKNITGKKLDIYSPGIGTQGGNAKKAISNGSDFVIVGRTILNSKDPVYVAKQLQLACI